MSDSTANKFQVGDRVRATERMLKSGIAMRVRDEGVIAVVSEDGYMVKFNDSGIRIGLDDADLESVEGLEHER